MLQIQGIHTYYAESHILHELSLEVAQGELVCLLGRNGAGKTTTIRSVIGYNKPRRGRIVFGGREITGLAPNHIARLGIGLVPQGRHIFRDLSVKENLQFAMRPGYWDVKRVYNVFPRLAERQKNRGDQLSGGEQQMLAIARALLMNPHLMLMDEPSEGLAPLIVREISRVIQEVKREGLSVLLVEQNLALGLSVADRCYIVNKGQIVYEAGPAELAADEAVKQRYLGV
ncbi:MAG: ABC transporter ATP-binding protein [Chloroflexota bacterium]